MAKCEIKNEPEYVLTLSKEEAQFIRELASHCTHVAAMSPIHAVSEALEDAGIGWRGDLLTVDRTCIRPQSS